VNSLPKTVTRHRRGCDLNPGPSAPESSTLTTRLPSHPCLNVLVLNLTFITGADVRGGGECRDTAGREQPVWAEPARPWSVEAI